MNCIFEVNPFCQSVNCAVYYKHVIQVGDLCITMRGLTQILVNVDRMDITVHLKEIGLHIFLSLFEVY